MLKELLPKLIHPKPEKSPDQTNQNLNLLEQTEATHTFRENLVAVQNSIFVKIPIIFIQLFFLVVIAVNFLLNKQLDRYVKSTDSLVESIQKFDGVDTEAQRITRKIDLYKSIRDSRPKISDEAAFLIDNIPADVALKKFSFQGNNFSILVDVANPFSLAKLISTYFDNAKLHEIIIKSATYQNSTKTYLINFDINFTSL